jgi:hypothetical protein
MQRFYALACQPIVRPVTEDVDAAGGKIMIDYNGSIFEEHRPAGESIKAHGLIDIEQLRSHRHSTNAMNFI